jgi:hypothetical protein
VCIDRCAGARLLSPADPLFACGCERGWLSYRQLAVCSSVCSCWRQKVDGALRLLRRLDFAGSSPRLGMDDAVLALQRVGASLTELDLSELSARKPFMWCLTEESSRKMLSALASFRHPGALQALALPPANPFYAVANCLTSAYTSLTHLKMRFGHSLMDRGCAALSSLTRLTRLTALEIEGRFGNDGCSLWPWLWLWLRFSNTPPSRRASATALAKS